MLNVGMRIAYMELEVERRRPEARPKKTWSKVMEEDMRKLNITEDMAEKRKQKTVEATDISQWETRNAKRRR